MKQETMDWLFVVLLIAILGAAFGISIAGLMGWQLGAVHADLEPELRVHEMEVLLYQIADKLDALLEQAEQFKCRYPW